MKQVRVEAIPDSILHTTEKGNTVLHIIGLWLHDEPEHASYQSSYQSIVEWLLSVGADITAQNRQGQTPVQFNLAMGSETLAELLSDYS